MFATVYIQIFSMEYVMFRSFENWGVKVCQPVESVILPLSLCIIIKLISSILSIVNIQEPPDLSRDGTLLSYCLLCQFNDGRLTQLAKADIIVTNIRHQGCNSITACCHLLWGMFAALMQEMNLISNHSRGSHRLLGSILKMLFWNSDHFERLVLVSTGPSIILG